MTEVVRRDGPEATAEGMVLSPPSPSVPLPEGEECKPLSLRWRQPDGCGEKGRDEGAILRP